jgi:glycosyltransferase involved in cell wall biosynthesis
LTVLPKISIITPSFNQGKYIEQTILSVLNQNYPNLEYIIIDGGSTDETVSIIKKYESQITYWVSEKDNGQTDAINKGFAKCSGQIFNWLNSDDYYEPNALHTIAQLFMNHPTAQVVCGKEWGFQDQQPQNKISHPGSIIKQQVFETIRVGIIDQPCTFFKIEAIKNIFPLNHSLRYVMDRQLWWGYLLQHGQNNIICTQQVFTNFRLHAQSKSVADAEWFEKDFDRLKISLCKQLNAPEILLQQIENDLPELNIQWKINIAPKENILAAFAGYYAQRCYEKENLATTAQLMRWVKKWKGLQLSSSELKLWVATCLVPKPMLMALKKLKHKL